MRKLNRMGMMLPSLAAIAIATGQAGPVAAQAAATADGESGEIVVTAQKRQERLIDIPLSVTAISGEQIANRGLQELSQVAKVTPGLYWENISVTKPQVFIRGFGTTGFDAGGDPSVAVYLDEVYMPRFAGMSMELLDVERVEVLKGPQGTLFGRNAAGGAINVVSMRPTSDFTAKLKAGFGRYDELDLRGTVSGPLADGIKARLSFSSRDGNGYVDVVGSPNDAFDTNRTMGRGQVEFDLGADASLLLSADYGRVREGMWAMKNSGQATPQVHPSVTVPRIADPFREAYDFNGYQNSDTWSVSSRLELGLGFADFVSISAFRNSKLDEFTDFDASPADAIRRQFAEDSDSFQQELRLTSKSGRPVEWIAGLYYFHEKVDRLGRFYAGRDNSFAIGFGPFPGNGRVPFSNLDTRTITTNSYAAFGQVSWEFAPRFKLTAGGRYSKDRKRMNRDAITVGATDLVNPFLDNAFSVKVRDSWSSFDPSITLDYKPTDDSLVYASYRRGYKSGGFQTDPVANAAAASVTFDPEKVRSAEIGAKASLFDRRLQISTAAFYNKYKNLQFLSTVSLGGGRFASLIDNIAAAEAKGFEVEVHANPAEGLNLSIGYSYLKSEYESYTTPAGRNLAGHQTSRSPSNLINGTASYAVPLASGKLEFSGSVSYTDSFYFEASNPAVYAKEKPYTIVDGSISYETGDGRWRFSLWGKNLTDTTYRTHNIVIVVTPSPLVASSLDTYTKPRTIGASVTFNLN